MRALSIAIVNFSFSHYDALSHNTVDRNWSIEILSVDRNWSKSNYIYILTTSVEMAYGLQKQNFFHNFSKSASNIIGYAPMQKMITEILALLPHPFIKKSA